LFTDAIKEANELVGGNQLKTFWDRVGLRATGPFLNFFWPNKHTFYKKYVKFAFLWSRNPINEYGKLEIFNRMERAKLCSAIID
jgi:hypothetical protein